MAAEPSTYSDRGVSATKEDVHAAIDAFDRGLYPGAFCKVVSDVLGDPAYCSVMHADGAGTKSSLAYIHYKQTGDASVFRGIAEDSIVMNLDDMLCVGVTSDFVVSNTIGRNAHRIDGSVVAEIIAGYEAFAARMEPHGIKMLMAGGETADVGDLVATVIVDSTVFARMRRADVIDASTIRPGDAIVGLASFGRATYETRENSGIASNGFTAARHMLLSKSYARQFPETYSATMAERDVYSGDKKMGDRLEGSQQTVGQALLSPTRTYLPVAAAVLAAHRGDISGLVQNSGGGLVKSKSFGRGLHYVKDNLFNPPPIFRALAHSRELSPRELYQVFNMGQRLEIYCSPAVADDIIGIAATFDVAGQVIGEVASHSGVHNKLTIKHGQDTFVF